MTVGLLAGGIAHAQAAAESDPVGVAVHVEAGFALLAPTGKTVGSDKTPAVAAIAVGAGYQIGPRYEIDLTLGSSASGARAALPVAEDPRDQIPTSPGMFVRALAHMALGPNRLRAVVGAGPAVFVGGSYGVVPVLDAEAGLEWRARRGLFVLIAYQILEPLLISRSEFDSSRCVTSDCPSRFDPRAPLFGLRLSAGVAF